MFTQDALFALLLSVIAGSSTMLGTVLLFFTKGKSEKLVTASLGFAAGVMLSVSFLDLFPQAKSFIVAFAGNTVGILLTVSFLCLGVLVAAGLDRLVPHEEHGDDGREHKNLFRVGFVSMVAIGLHNFPEGIATFMAGYSDRSLGISIMLAIAMHNIPEGISVAMPIYFATGSKLKAVKYTFLSGVAEPIGALLAFILLRPFINDLMMGVIFAIVIGIMLYISIEELIPSSRQYGYKRLSLISVFAGIVLMPLADIL
ncbi:MAG: zinc transporter ZupT [Eubacteriales bacterium]